ncbi:MAG: metallophosphoesterase, partial [Deltaproteobacteria bacterium]|nr:metallophosphoesterase [Deltaproteobacteria bacterium]
AATQPVIDLFEQAGPHVIHVIGNHDTDNGYTFQQVLESWKMPARHGVHDLGLIRVIVLNGNVRPPNHSGGYPAHIGPQQLEWLSAELARTNAPPAIILCHQPLAGPWSVDDAADVQRAISAAGDQVLCVLNGHSHIDYVLRVDGVTYVHINSASYQWVGGDHRHASYEEPVHAQYPSIQYTCPYRDPLYAFMTVDLGNDAKVNDPISDQRVATITIEGRNSTWVGPSPAQLGKDMHPDLTDGEQIAPRIRSRVLTPRTASG